MYMPTKRERGGKMMKQNKTAIWRVFEFVALYLAFFFAQNLVFADLLVVFCPEFSFGECYVIAMLGRMYEASASIEVGILAVCQNLLLTIAGAILTGFIFRQVVHIEPKVLLPEKLVLRKRHSDDTIVMNVMVGNRGKSFLYNTKCTITCYYASGAKVSGSYAGPHMNGECVCEDTTAVVQNYYRFGFSIMDIPKKFLEDYINKTEDYEKDYVFVMVSGSVEHLGQLQPFQVVKQYRLKDIVFGKSADHFKQEKVNLFTGKVERKVLWDRVMNPVELGEDDRQRIVTGINEIVKNKK